MNARFEHSLGESIALHCGQWVPASSLRWSATDRATTHAAIVVERLRTFGGRPFAIEAHQRRLMRGMSWLEITEGEALSERIFGGWIDELLRCNRHLVEAMQDVGIVVLVSPGDPGWDEGSRSSPTVMMHLSFIPFRRLQKWYAEGCQLATTPFRNMPPECLPPELKSRNRLHYWLAERAAAKNSGDLPLLLDIEGHVAESSIANVLMVAKGGTVVTPRLSRILPGVSLAITLELCRSVGIEVREDDFDVDALYRAHEVLLSGTTGCLWPAVKLDGRNIGSGRPGPMFRRLAELWKNRIGTDFIGQANGYDLK